MKDEGIDKGLVQKFDTSDRMGKGHYYGFRKMFWKYLNKLNVGFYDPCCPESSDKFPVFIDRATGDLMYINAVGVATLVPPAASIAGGTPQDAGEPVVVAAPAPNPPAPPQV